MAARVVVAKLEEVLALMAVWLPRARQEHAVVETAVPVLRT
jgi:hypothetical protein